KPDAVKAGHIGAILAKINELKSYLQMPRDVVITTHRNPDGDALGSSLGLYHYLLRNGHAVKIICPSEYPLFFSWMPGVEDMIIYDSEPERAEQLLSEAEMIFCLDFNSLERIDKVGEYIAKLNNCRLAMIDHHLYPDIQADFEISKPSASSTCELVYDFLESLGDLDQVDTIVGECLMTGILTDTGSFKYSTSPRLFKVVAGLIERGVDDYKLQDLLFNSQEEKHLRLLGHCLNNRMEIIKEYKAGIIYLNRHDYERFDIQRGDTEGIVNFLLKMREVKVAAFITEQPTIVKISLRSKGEISVQEIARKHFKGGGHKNAAGGSSYKSLRSTVQKFKEVLAEYKTVLQD
ncbi:MAG: bifunctional oligoribonuclease/PAP phosphatase NrnA, partial [Bacteroidota bacterium]